MSLETVIRAAGRAHLGPIGVVQRNRSRIWLDDQGWWLGIVEFQPSSWSKGCYLNVAGSWLWEAGGDMPFHWSERVSSHIEYVDDEQFGPQADRLAGLAAARIQAQRGLVTSPAVAADVILRRDNPSAMWRHAGMAHALAGQPDEAAACLDRYLTLSAADDRDWAVAERADVSQLLQSAGDAESLRAAVEERIADSRHALRLPPWPAP